MERFSWEGDLTTPLASALTSVEASQPFTSDSFFVAEHHASGNMMLSCDHTGINKSNHSTSDKHADSTCISSSCSFS